MTHDGNACGYPIRLLTASGYAWREWYGGAKKSESVAASTLATECTWTSAMQFGAEPESVEAT